MKEKEQGKKGETEQPGKKADQPKKEGEKRIVTPQDDRWWSRIIQEILVFTLVHYIGWGVVWFILLYIFCHSLTHTLTHTLGWGTGEEWWLSGDLLVVTCLLLYLPGFISPVQMNLGRPWPAFRRHSLWRWVHRHVGTDVRRTSPPLSPDRAYIFGYHPHGILILSRVLVYGGVWEELFPGIEFRALGASAMFYLPGCREMCLWMGAQDASRSATEKTLKKGISVHVYPGGSKEIFSTTPGSKSTHLVLKDRKGFIRLAIKYGCPLVPTVVFGEQESYHKLEINKGVKDWFLKNLRIPLLIFWGKYFTWVPLRKPLALVYGTPIEVQKNPNPSEEEVLSLQKIYIKAVEDLFNTYKKDYPFAKDQKLVIE